MYAVILNRKLSANTTRRKKDVKRGKKVEKREIIKIRNGSSTNQENLNYYNSLTF